MQPAGTLLFVYDADASLASLAAEVAHRTFAPDTYVCNLCKVSFGLTGKKPAWRKYLRSLERRGYGLRFSLRKPFRKRYPEHADVDLPALLQELPDQPPRLLVDKPTLDRVRDLDELIAAVEEALPEVTPRS